MRSITEDAGVNAAAIHYHFGSKERLLDAVISRRVLPLNQERLKRLEHLEFSPANIMLPSQALLRAFLEPFVVMQVELGERTSPFGKLMARLWIEREQLPRPPLAFDDLVTRFAAAACRGRTDLLASEAAERLEWAVSATARMLHGARATGSEAVEPAADRFERLIAFLAAGLDAPGSQGPGATS